jgi:hypothetical protein
VIPVACSDIAKGIGQFPASMVLAVSNTALVAATLDAVFLASGEIGGKNVGTYLRHVVLYEGLSCPCSRFNLLRVHELERRPK